MRLTLHRNWEVLADTADRRHIAGLRLLQHLLSSVPEGNRGTDLLAETTVRQAARHDPLGPDAEKREPGNPEKLLDRALLWLHEQQVIRLNKDLSVFTPALSIQLASRTCAASPTPISRRSGCHCQDQVLQIHTID